MAENGKPTGDLWAGDDALVAALAAGSTVPDAAKRANMSERTARRRLDDPAFRRRVSEARGELYSAAMGRLAAVATKAADTLEKLLTSTRDAVALGAARSILELGQRLRESVELEQRIAALERGAVEQTATPWEGTHGESVS